MNYLKKILTYALPYKKYAFLNIISNIFYALFGALSFFALMPMLNVLFPKDGEVKVVNKPVYTGIRTLGDYFNDTLAYQIQSFAQDDKSKALVFVIVLVVVTFLLKNLFNYLGLYFGTFLRNGILKDLRDDLYDKTINLPISFYSEKRKGDIIARISNDVAQVKNSFLAVLEMIIKEPLSIVFSIGGMLIISVKLTIFVFIFIPVSGFIISAIGKRLKRQSAAVQNEQGIFLSTVEETLNGLKVIKGFNAEGIFNSKFQDSTKRYFHFSNILLNRQNLSSPVSEILGIVTISVLLWFGGRMVLLENSLDSASFLTFMGLAYNILTPAKAISKASYAVKQGNAAAERVLEIIETKSPIEDAPNAKTLNGFNEAISIDNIYFKYEDEYVLKDFSIKVPKGKTVALVGQSGSGKSTIANLVTRFYDVNKGSISIDGQNIKDLTKNSLRSTMGLVTQDSILFNDSIKNNILVGKPNATDQEIIEALKIANAWEFVKDLPKVLETNIGDSGNKLSGGQKQRLSIARAVLKNPPIMILDEATSALDTESERLVQDALENMMKNRTSIVIAHRLSTIQNADEIIVMQKGEIAEQGKHETLIAKNGIYKKLVDMQSFE
ncbi:ABC transporter ATP-binding protein [Lacinutrix sp. MedPE-SW]|uniref:ABC transporter ATP-binding protein n=1 Tax=Lacinutrix sp. MedPE-SW TaxID=1860087 RepID=UPI00090EC26A|nr:ABC transporter ATP-binding protein [Lacinutrix sp. MedPE-SW]OIQ22926.1 MAG: antibiotic ABC transporter ATP-binding protein [Lacinutrix sp. MedPE-SW]